MAKSQARSVRKVSGKIYRAYRKKKKYELGREPAFTSIGEKKLRDTRIRGGNQKLKLLSIDKINVYDSKSRTFKPIWR